MKIWRIYELAGSDGVVRYVELERSGNKPWEALWANRQTLKPSPLVDWLVALPAPPTVTYLIPELGPLPYHDAVEMLSIRRDEVRNGGGLLSRRPHDSFAGGAKAKRPVIDGDGNWHEGVRACARALGYTHTRIYQLATNRERGFHYDDCD